MNKVFYLVGAMALLGGCSSMSFNDKDPEIMERPPEVIDKPPEAVTIGKAEVPSWFLDMPEDTESRIYSVGTGISDDLQFSIDKAVHDAKINLADKMASKSSAEIKAFISDNGKGGQGQTTRKIQKVSKSGFKNIDVSRYTIEERSVVQDRRYFRTYVQLSIDPNDRYDGGDVVNTYNPQDEVIATQAMDDL